MLFKSLNNKVQFVIKYLYSYKVQKKLCAAIFGSLLIFCLSLISNAAEQDKTETQKKKILVTIYPYYLILNELCGDKVELDILIPPSSSPHSYSLKPSDLSRINRADLIIANGLQLEYNLEKKINEDKTKSVFVSNLLGDEYLKNLNAQFRDDDKHEHEKEASSAKEDHDGHHHGAINQHIWLEPEMVSKIVEELSQIVIKQDPKNAELYQANTNKMLSSLKTLDEKIKGERALYKEANIITFHASFDYFVGKYNINLADVFEPLPGKQPTIKDLAEMGEKIKKYNVKAIFTEPQLNTKSAEVISKEFGLKILILDPLGKTLNPQSIADLIDKNWQIMKSGFVK